MIGIKIFYNSIIAIPKYSEALFKLQVFIKHFTLYEYWYPLHLFPRECMQMIEVHFSCHITSVHMTELSQ